VTYARAVKKPTPIRSNHATDSLRALESYLYQELDIFLYLEPVTVTAPVTHPRSLGSGRCCYAQLTKRLITDSGTQHLLQHFTTFNLAACPVGYLNPAVESLSFIILTSLTNEMNRHCQSTQAVFIVFINQNLYNININTIFQFVCLDHYTNVLCNRCNRYLIMIM
jgi:hypothetical protein